MAKKILNLQLFYRGKHLDTIREIVDFNKSWTIGTDKHLFWQILDASRGMPRKHKFLEKRGGDYYLHLPGGSNLSCSKDGRPLDANDLQSGGILTGSFLKLNPSLSGTVQLNPDYEIRFEYTEPRVVVLKPQEQAVVNSSMQPRTMSAQERNQTGFILLFLILGIAFVLIYDLVVKPRLDKAKAFVELSELEKARRIEADQSLVDPSSRTTVEQQELDQPDAADGEEPQKTAADKKKTVPRTTGRPGRRDTGSTDVSKVFGQTDVSGPGPGSPRPHYGVTGLQTFVTAAPGVRSGDGVGGIGRPSSFDPKASSGFAGTYDPSNIQGYDPGGAGVGRVADKLPQQAGSLLPPGVPTQTFTGDASRLKPSSSSPTQSIPSAQEQAKKVTQSVTTPKDVSKLSEPEVKIPKPAYTGSDANVIYSQVSGRRAQIEQAYRRHSAIKRQTGSITVVMNIAADGAVNAQVSSSSASFTQAFLSEVKRIVESWRFNVSQATKYQFRVTLTA